MPIINIVLLISVVGLSIVCVLSVYYPPESTVKSDRDKDGIPFKMKRLPALDKDTKSLDYYELVLSNNPFSPDRTALVSAESKTDTKTDTKHEASAAPLAVAEQKPKGTPKNIKLVGILILGNTRKALIENPDRAQNNKPFIFLEEGEEIAEYKVKNIEPDQIILDWYGEEKIFVMRSNIKK